LPWLAHAHNSTASQSDLDRLDWERSVSELGLPPEDAGVDPGPRGEAPPYLENPLDTYATIADQDAQIQAEAARAAEPPEREAAELEADAADDWRKRSDRHRVLSTLRAAMEHATGVQIMDRDGHRLACGVDGELQQHAESGRRRFLVYKCHRRDRCPECAVGYGEERGDELASLLDAVATLAPQGKRMPAGFGFEITLPEPVTEYIGAALDRGDFPTARRALSKLSKIARALTWDAVKRKGIEKSDVGAALNIHAFHSRTPMRRGWHFHAHVTIPNVTRRGEHLRRLGKLGKMPAAGGRVKDRGRERLDVLRDRLRELVLREYGADVDLSELKGVNLHWHYFGAGRKGAQGFRKRAYYVSRSPWHDAAKQAASHPDRVYSDAGMVLLGRFADRVEALQAAVRTRRYLGWLSPGQRKGWGLVKDEGQKSPWTAVPRGYRRIIKATATGLWLRAYDAAGEWAEHVDGALVTWSPVGPPRRWQTAAQRDEKKRRAAAATGETRGAAAVAAVSPGLFGMMPA